METIDLLMGSMIVGGVIIPVVQGLKKFSFFDAVKPQYLSAILAFLAVWGLSYFFNPGMEIAEIVASALASIGMSATVHAPLKHTKMIK